MLDISIIIIVQSLSVLAVPVPCWHCMFGLHSLRPHPSIVLVTHATNAQTNGLQMLVRAHECVMDGFERFAQGHLITLFSATNYCGTANNAGAILVLGRDLVRVYRLSSVLVSTPPRQVMVPKLIHPLPPNTPTTPKSPSSRSEDIEDEPSMAHTGANDTWMQVCAAVHLVGWEAPCLSPRTGHQRGAATNTSTRAQHSGGSEWAVFAV